MAYRFRERLKDKKRFYIPITMQNVAFCIVKHGFS